MDDDVTASSSAIVVRTPEITVDDETTGRPQKLDLVLMQFLSALDNQHKFVQCKGVSITRAFRRRGRRLLLTAHLHLHCIYSLHSHTA